MGAIMGPTTSLEYRDQFALAPGAGSTHVMVPSREH
jgi:hypothetical protein